MAIIIEMPKLSDTMTAGTVVSWLKTEGDKVTAGDKLAEVETDKATMELENFDEGVLLRIYAPAGSQVNVGGPICAIGDPGEPAPDLPTPAAAAAKTPRKASREPATGKAAADSSGAAPEPSSAPKDSPKRAKGKGGAVPPAGDGAEEEKDGSAEAPRSPAILASVTTAEGGRLKASPLARKSAAEKGIDLAQVRGSGPGGRILREDVERVASQPRPAPEKGGGGTLGGVAEDLDLPLSNIRRVIAQRLIESKTTIPHFYLETEVDAGPLTDLRGRINASLADLPPDQGGIKLTVNDFILRAVALALMRVPSVNRSWQEESIRQFGSAHVAFGVAVEDGLLTPVIRHAQTKGLRQIALEAKDLIGRARARKLKPDEMSGSTFTVTNLGMFGVTHFYGIINPPNAAILSVGATIKQPVVDNRDQIVVGYRMKLGLSCDHRVVDGAAGAEFLSTLRQMLENPAILLV